METAVKVRPTIMIIFGAAANLTRRKLMPVIYDLYLDGL
jgi:glucose-6-phosphate 1-dehydrogenase